MKSLLTIGSRLAPAIFLLSAIACPAAGDVLDQEYNGFTDSLGLIGLGGSQDLHRAQTFTVGLTGTLTRVQTAVTQGGANSPLLAEIRTTSAGIPNEPNGGANTLGMVSVPANLIPVYIPPTPPAPVAPQAFFEFDFSSQSISVAAGQTLALVLRTDDPSNFAYQWDMVHSSSYAGGEAFVWTPGAGWHAQSANNTDHRFRTFVAPIPEPAAGLSALTAAVAAWAATRRRR